jgi:hypothetical protein
MAEVGLLPFARVALQVATQVLPPYRTRFSKHQFTQPQLLAVLCLMRYEDWTFREAEVRLREHHELRAVLKLPAVPDYTTLYRFLRRLEDDTVDRGLQETVRRLRRRRSRPISAAIDGTGLSDTSVSTFFHRRLEQHAHGPRPRRPWLKWLIVVDVRQQILLAQRARQGPGCDARALPGLLDVAARGAPIGVVLADAEFDSEANHEHIRQRLGAQSIIPARRRGVPNGAIRNQMFRAFPKKPYRQRNKIESVFSAVKRKLSSRAPGRSLATQIRQALLLGLAYNIYRLRHHFPQRGCQQSPTLVGAHVSVASKGVVYSKIVERAVCFVSVANRGLRPKNRLQKAETPASGWRSPVRARYYPRNTVRWDSLFVNRKLEKSRVSPRRNGGGKGKTRNVSSQPSRK